MPNLVRVNCNLQTDYIVLIFVQEYQAFFVKYAGVLSKCNEKHLNILTQSAHPLALFFLYFFRIAAIAVYILCGWFTSNYVLSVSCYFGTMLCFRN